ncbi:MAG: N-acetylmuramoyl-L-alanine amidase [Dethiobacteria bacterium]
MKTSYFVDHIPASTPHNRRPGLHLAPEYITIHSTGNPGSTARNERAWLTNPINSRTASWHICVDEKEAIEAIPLNETAWHAGDGAGGPGNRKSIGIEICESGNREKTLARAAALAAGLLQQRGWGVERLRRHFDWSGKACPRIFMDNDWAGWDAFKHRIQIQLGNNQEGSAAENISAADPGKTLPQVQRRVEGTLNGRPLNFAAYLIDNVTYVPLRPLAEALKIHLAWQEEKFHIQTTP